MNGSIERASGRVGRRARRRWGLLAAAVMLASLGGCKMPAASLQLLDGLDTALTNVSDGQQAVRQALDVQLDGQQRALDTAFEADLRNLAATQADAAEPSVKLADVLEAKKLYDSKLADIQAGQSNATTAFDRLDNNLAASRQMVDMLRRLVLQQHLLAGQAELAVNTLLKRSSGK